MENMNAASKVEEYEKIQSYRGDFSQFDNSPIRVILAARKKYAEEFDNPTLSEEDKVLLDKYIIWCNSQIKLALAL